MKKKAIVDKTAETQEALGLVNPHESCYNRRVFKYRADRNRNVLKTVLEDANGSRLEGISFGDVKADLHYTESKDTVCLLYYPEINEFQGRRTVQAVIESWSEERYKKRQKRRECYDSKQEGNSPLCGACPVSGPAF